MSASKKLEAFFESAYAGFIGGIVILLAQYIVEGKIMDLGLRIVFYAVIILVIFYLGFMFIGWIMPYVSQLLLDFFSSIKDIFWGLWKLIGR